MTTRTKQQRPSLRLTRDTDVVTINVKASSLVNVSATYPFPKNPEARRLLIAGKVHVPAYPEASDASTSVSPSHDDVVGRIGTDTLIRDIESTLDQMQSRLDDFKRQVDDTIPFPTPPDPSGPFRPRAA